MSLALKIDDQIKEAMKAKEADRLSVLRMLKSAMKYAVIEKYGAEGEAKDEDVLAAVRKEIKKRRILSKLLRRVDALNRPPKKRPR